MAQRRSSETTFSLSHFEFSHSHLKERIHEKNKKRWKNVDESRLFTFISKYIEMCKHVYISFIAETHFRPSSATPATLLFGWQPNACTSFYAFAFIRLDNSHACVLYTSLVLFFSPPSIFLSAFFLTVFFSIYLLFLFSFISLCRDSTFPHFSTGKFPHFCIKCIAKNACAAFQWIRQRRFGFFQ